MKTLTLRGDKLFHFPIMQQVYFYLSTLHKKVEKKNQLVFTFAVHNAVVFVVFYSLPSHIQQPLGASSQYHRD